MSELKAALELARNVGLKDGGAEEVSKIAKRMFSMIVSSGLVSTLLFAYSKAKNNSVKSAFENYQNAQLGGEEGKWALVTAFLVKNLNFSNPDLISVVSELLNDRVKMAKCEDTSLRYLKALSRVLDALA